MKKEIVELRQLMAEKDIDAYYVPSGDFHSSEYVNDYFKARAFMTNLTGESGELIVTQDGAWVWTDGRYFLQAEEQLAGTEIELMRMAEPGVPTVEEFMTELVRKHNETQAEKKFVLGFDGRVVPGSFDATAKEIFGEECGAAVSVIAAEMRSAIACAFENDMDGILIRMELLLELYSSVTNFGEGEVSDGELADFLKKDIYLYVSDYYETESVKRIGDLVDPGKDFAYKVVMSSGEDTDYLYRFGEYITDNEIKTAKFLNSLDEAEIESMASTFTEGYRRGFVLTGKDLSKKTSVNINFT